MVTTCTRPLYSYSLQAGSVHTIDIYKYFDLQVTIWCSLHVPIYKVSYLVLFKQYYLRCICPFIRLFFWFIQLNVSPNRLLGLVHLCFFLIWVKVRIRVWCLTPLSAVFQLYSELFSNEQIWKSYTYIYPALVLSEQLKNIVWINLCYIRNQDN